MKLVLVTILLTTTAWAQWTITSVSAGPVTPPSAPTGLMATAISSSRIDLSWTASPGATSYTVLRSSTSGGPFTSLAASITGTTYSDMTAPAASTLYYVVRAVNTAGTSGDSNQASATTPSPPVGGVITAIDCNLGAVQAALGLINQDGMTVKIPAGDCVWTGLLSYTQVYSFTLQGAGAQVPDASCTFEPGQSCTTPSGTDQTIIEDNIARTVGTGPAVLEINTIAGKYFRMTGLAFYRYPGNVTTASDGTVRVGGGSTQIRIDHNHFNIIWPKGQDYDGTLALHWRDVGTGVFDHNWVDHAVNAVFTNGSNDDWYQGDIWGQGNQKYLENNVFVNRGANVTNSQDCAPGGGWQVMRYNTLRTSSIQQHNGISQTFGCRGIEAYKNTATNDRTLQPYFFYARSGSALVWGNYVQGYTNIITSAIDRTGTENTFYRPAPNNWGRCGGTVPWFGVVVASGTNAIVGTGFNTAWLNNTPFAVYDNVAATGVTIKCQNRTAAPGVPAGSANPQGCVVRSVQGSNQLTLDGSLTCPNPGSQCYAWVGSAWDGNTDMHGYPCFEQMGRGQKMVSAPLQIGSPAFPNMNNPDATSGGMNVVTVTSGGSGYQVGDLLMVTSCGAVLRVRGDQFTGSPPVQEAPGIDANGAVTVVLVVFTGYGCTKGTGQAVTGGHGTGATFNVNSLIAWPSEKLTPVYAWGNTFNPTGTAYYVRPLPDTNAGSVLEGRDYYVEQPNYDNPTGVNCAGQASCANQVGQGTLALRPANCTTNPLGGGAAYWATDEQNLYQCTATNTWTLYYHPYTYPHPLTTLLNAAIVPKKK